MFAVLSYLCIPVLLAAVFFVITARYTADPERRHTLWFRSVVAACISVLLFTGLHLTTLLLFASYGKPLPVLAVLITSLGLQLGARFPKTDVFCEKRPRLCRFFRCVGRIAVICLLIEIFVCNVASVCPSFRQEDIAVMSCTSDTFAIENDTVTIDGNGTLTVKQELDGIAAIGLHFTAADASVKLTVKIKDDNFSEKLVRVVERRIAVGNEQVYVPFSPYGTVHEIELTFSDPTEPLTLHKIYAANALPFVFNALRFFVLFGLSTTVTAIVCGRLHTVKYDRKNRSHKALICLALAMCLCVSAAMMAPLFPLEDNETAYPFENAGGRSAYIQQFDAFQKRQLHLDLEVDPSLSALDNPYDDSLRSEQHVQYNWDRAFYNGKYYSYFGITPLLTVYYPYFAVRQALPDISFACGVFALSALVFLWLLVLRLVKMFCGKVNLILLLLSLFACTAVSGIWWAQALASDYSLPFLSGLCFLFFTLWSGLYGYDSRHRFLSPLMLMLCGAGVALTVGSRPTLLIGCLALAPFFIHLLVRKDVSLKRKIVSAAAFLVPTLLGAAGLMVYNHLRFGSPFDFGSTYQLTVSNVAANSLSLSLLPATVCHYFLQPMTMSGEFPFWRPSFTPLLNYGRYVFAESCVGILAFPHVLTAAVALPTVAKKTGSPVKRALYILVPILAFVAAFCNMCMGGVTLRYVSDATAVLSVIAVPVFLELYHRLEKSNGASGRRFALFAVCLTVSAVMGLCVLFSCSSGVVFTKLLPQLLPCLEDTVAFWR